MAILRSIAGRSAGRAGPSVWCLAVALISFGSGQSLISAPKESVHEYQIKAVFLFNFAQFVEWPPAALDDPAMPLVIGVLGDDPFGSVLDDVVQGESVKSRPLVIRRFRRIEEIDICHILFISPSENARIDTIVSRLKGRSILTVSDVEGSARRGVMVRFFTENKRLRLRINLGAARDSGLVLSSKLLRPAQIVDDGEATP